MSSSNVYFVDSNKQYEPSRPSPTQNLLDLYQLDNLVSSVARNNPDGTKGIKLRKSYKSHISDLPGKHNSISTARDISPIVFRPKFEGVAEEKVEIKPLDPGYLQDKLRFDRTPDTGIPDFDVNDLAVGDMVVKGGDETKKRKKKPTDEESAKRRKL